MSLGALLMLGLPAAGVAAENQALKLDGAGSYVELPTAHYETMTQATVEVWAKWDELKNHSRIFQFGKPWNSMTVYNPLNSSDLRYNIFQQFARDDHSRQHIILVTNAIRPGEWMHIAAVSGPGGMLLYLNGRLIGQHPNTASFADLPKDGKFFLGHSPFMEDEDLRGEIDEMRIWNYRRSPEEIRAGMFKRLNGTEEGLVHLWNFDDGTANDMTSNGAHGRFFGNAQIVPSELGLVSQIAVAPVPEAINPPVAVMPPTPQVVEVKTADNSAVALWIAGAVTLLAFVLAWLAFMFRRSGLGSEKLVGARPAVAQLPAEAPGPERIAAPKAVPQELREQALAELTSFAKESLVQGLFTQRAALLEAQKQAQQELAQLEARLAKLDVHDRILAYETRIADLERQVASRGDEVEGLTKVTLQLLRRKLAEEKGQESATRYN